MWGFRALPDKRSVRTQTLLAATKAVQRYMRFTKNDSSGEANLLPGSAVSFPNGRHIFLIFLFFILLVGSFLPWIGRFSAPRRAVFRPIDQRRLRRKPILKTGTASRKVDQTIPGMLQPVSHTPALGRHRSMLRGVSAENDFAAAVLLDNLEVRRNVRL